MSDQQLVQPVVGMGATLCYPQDQYPYRITKVSLTGSVIEVERLVWATPAEIAAGSLDRPMMKPDYMRGPYPIYARIVDATNAPVMPHWKEAPERAYRNAQGGYAIGGTPLNIGVARYRRDWSD